CLAADGLYGYLAVAQQLVAFDRDGAFRGQDADALVREAVLANADRIRSPLRPCAHGPDAGVTMCGELVLEHGRVRVRAREAHADAIAGEPIACQEHFARVFCDVDADVARLDRRR